MDAGEYLRSVVRVFPDYAHTVLWFAPGPVAYDDARITQDLAHEMQEWEASYYAGLTPELGWRPEFDTDAYDVEGLRLAHRLAEELGDAYDVEVHLLGAGHAVIRGDGPGTNPAARSAFQRMARDSAEAAAEAARLRVTGPHSRQ